MKVAIACVGFCSLRTTAIQESFCGGLHRVVDGKPLIRKPFLDLFRSSGTGRDDRRSFLSDISSILNVRPKL